MSQWQIFSFQQFFNDTGCNKTGQKRNIDPKCCGVFPFRTSYNKRTKKIIVQRTRLPFIFIRYLRIYSTQVIYFEKDIYSNCKKYLYTIYYILYSERRNIKNKIKQKTLKYRPCGLLAKTCNIGEKSQF